MYMTCRVVTMTRQNEYEYEVGYYGHIHNILNVGMTCHNVMTLQDSHDVYGVSFHGTDTAIISQDIGMFLHSAN